MEYLYLVRLGLRDANDPRIQNTLKVAEALLRVETPNGTAYRRYNGDGYGEHEDGRPFDGIGDRPCLAAAGRRARPFRPAARARPAALSRDDGAHDGAGRTHSRTGLGRARDTGART